MALDYEALKKIVATPDFNALIGEAENQFFDCKLSPYQLQTNSGKRELAKDVSSFANALGGFIFVGIKTKKDALRFGDEIEAINPFEDKLFNKQSYLDIIKDWIYPNINDLKIEWFIINAPDRGVVVIVIPPQGDSAKPFLIKNVLDGEKEIEIAFGYAERKGDVSSPTSLINLQTMLRSGLNYDRQIAQRFDILETLVRQGHQYLAGEDKLEDEIGERIEYSLKYENMHERKVFVLSAFPNASGDLKTIFDKNLKSIRSLLEQPNTLRRHGWSLDTLTPSQIIGGEIVRVTNGKRKVIDLYRDGVLVFGSLADANFLGWGKNGDLIHSLALIEATYNFVNFYGSVLDDFMEKPEQISIRFDFKNMHQEPKTYLAPYEHTSIQQITSGLMQYAPDDNISKTTGPFKTNIFEPTQVAYEVVRKIYLYFGLEEDKIPYVKEKDGVKIIDIEKIALL